LNAFEEMHRGMSCEDLGVLKSEWESMWQYYDALHDAISLAVEQSKSVSVTDEVWSLGDDWWVKDGTLEASDVWEHSVLSTAKA